MKQTKDFITDFVGVFVVMLFGALVVFFHIAHNIVSTILKFMNNIIKPAFIEFLADVNLILNIVWQGFLEVSSNILLNISKITLSWSQSLHNRAEKLLYKNWDI